MKIKNYESVWADPHIQFTRVENFFRYALEFSSSPENYFTARWINSRGWFELIKRYDSQPLCTHDVGYAVWRVGVVGQPETRKRKRVTLIGDF